MKRSPHPTDQEIVALYWARNETAISLSQEKYDTLCRSISSGILHNHEDTEECLNDLYLSAWNTIPPQSPNSLKYYLCKLIRRISVNKLTYRQAKKRDIRKTVSFEEAEAELNEYFHNECFTAEDSLLSEYINLYLSELPPKRRQILVLRYWLCDSVSEIARKTGTKQNTVKSILFRELAYLKRYLTEKGGYADEQSDACHE